MRRILIITTVATALLACNRATPNNSVAQQSNTDSPTATAAAETTDAAGRNEAEVTKHSEEVYNRQQAELNDPDSLSAAADANCTDHKTMVAKLKARGLTFDHTAGSMDVYTGNGSTVRVVSAGGQDCLS